MHIIDCAKIGADVVTTPLKSIKGLLKYPNGYWFEKFLDDYKREINNLFFQFFVKIKYLLIY